MTQQNEPSSRERLRVALREAAALVFADPIMKAATWPETKERMGISEMFVIAAIEKVSPLLAHPPAPQNDAERLRRQVELAVVRYQILLNRMNACMENDGHQVSKMEVPGWIDEALEALAAPDSAGAPRELGPCGVGTP